MIRTIILCIAVLLGCNALSQTRMDNWVFGDSAGINFSTGTAVAFKTKITSHETSASISDEEGNLLFYTNGETVWNKNHEIMLNGDTLDMAGISEPLHTPSTITQGAIIVPVPDDENKFYIFYIAGEYPIEGLDYAMVDMTMDGGLGSVTEKDIRIYTDETLWEKMQAVKHGNGRDWWLILHNGGWDDTLNTYFLKFLISPVGINDPEFQWDENTISGITRQMKFSNNGDKLALIRIYNNISLYYFNRCTGLISHEEKWVASDPSRGIYGCEFSPDGTKFYVTSSAGESISPNSVFQFCLNCPETIESSIDIIYSKYFEDNDHGFASIQLGSDNRIYIATPYSNANAHNFTDINTKITVINVPNVDGLGCNLDTLSIPLLEARCTLTLPNMPNYSLGPLVGSECDTLLAINSNPYPSGIHVYPNPAINEIYFSGNMAYSGSEVQLHVFNLLGEEVLSLNNIPFNTAIQLPELNNGLYEVVLENGKRRLYADELIIQK